MPLRTDTHLESPDEFYEALIEAHRELDAAQSQQLNAKLILLLANEVGRLDVLKAALATARDNTLANGTLAKGTPP